MVRFARRVQGTLPLHLWAWLSHNSRTMLAVMASFSHYSRTWAGHARTILALGVAFSHILALVSHLGGSSGPCVCTGERRKHCCCCLSESRRVSCILVLWFIRVLHYCWAFGPVWVLTVDGLGRALGSATACGRSDGLFGNSAFGVLRPGRAQHGSARAFVHTGV